MLLLIRHSATAWNNVDGENPGGEIMRGQLDAPLSELGRRIARREAEKWKGEPFRRIYASGYARDWETAQIFAQAVGAPVYRLDSLAPLNIGVYAGQPRRLVQPRLEWHMRNPRVPHPGGESVEMWFAEFAGAFEQLLQEARMDPRSHIAAVIHGSEFRALPAVMKGKSVHGVAVDRGVKPAETVLIQ